MCLSSVYELKDGEQRLVGDSVSSISVMEGHIKFTDIVGIEKTISGVIRSIDLIKNIILVEARS